MASLTQGVFGQMFCLQPMFWRMFVAIFSLPILLTANANSQAENAPPERLREMLAAAKEVLESDRYECPYLTMRVSPPPLENGRQPGWVLIIFDVSPGGKIVNEEIIDSSLDEKYQLEAIELIRSFRFVPRSLNGTAFKFENWVERVDFLPDEVAPNSSWPSPKQYFDVECDS